MSHSQIKKIAEDNIVITHSNHSKDNDNNDQYDKSRKIVKGDDGMLGRLKTKEENDLNSHQKNTLVFDYEKEQEVDRETESFKAKLIDDLFASSRLSKQSSFIGGGGSNNNYLNSQLLTNTNRNVNDLYDDKSIQSSTKRRMIDDLFSSERSVHTLRKREPTDHSLSKQWHIDPSLVIEEEQIVNLALPKSLTNTNQKEKDNEDNDILVLNVNASVNKKKNEMEKSSINCDEVNEIRITNMNLSVLKNNDDGNEEDKEEEDEDNYSSCTEKEKDKARMTINVEEIINSHRNLHTNTYLNTNQNNNNEMVTQANEQLVNPPFKIIHQPKNNEEIKVAQLPKTNIKQEEQVNKEMIRSINNQSYEMIIAIAIAPKTEMSYSKLKNATHESFPIFTYDQYSQIRKGFLSNEYFSSIISPPKPSSSPSIVYSYDYPTILYHNFLSLKDQYNMLFAHITINDRNALFNSLLQNKYTTPQSNNDSRRSINQSNNINMLYKVKDFKGSYAFRDDSPMEFDYYRSFEEDGNSFYRAFMFSYIESLILLEQKTTLLALILDLFRISEINSNVYSKIDIKQSMTFFAVLSDLIQSNQYDCAYAIFIASYRNNEMLLNVDYLFVIYIKFCLFSMIYEEERLSKEKNKENETIKPKAQTQVKIKNKSKNEDYVRDYDYLRDDILKGQMEPSKLVFEAIPFCFKATLIIHYLEGDSNSAVFQTNEYKNLTNPYVFGNDDNNPLEIHLGYFYSGYNCLYLKSIYKNNQQFTDINQLNLLKEHIPVSLSSNESKCFQCNTITKQAQFPQYKQSTCFNCLMKLINAILTQRAIDFSRESYLNLEYYSRKITLTTDLGSSLEITNANIISLSHNSIPSRLIQALQYQCFHCYSNENNSSSILRLTCNCQFCKSCLMFLIKTATEGNIILNRYERETLPKTPCLCNGPFNIQNALLCLDNTLSYFEEEYRNASLRFSKIILRKCMICTETLIKSNEEILVDDNSKGKKRRYYRVKIIKEANCVGQLVKGLDYCEGEHLICLACFRKSESEESIDQKTNSRVEVEVGIGRSSSTNVENGEKKESEKEKEKKNKGKVVLCSLCNIEHYVDRKDWDSRPRKNCCEDSCSVF